jgi:RNA polymerase sigma factor (sigma-70 family)
MDAALDALIARHAPGGGAQVEEGNAELATQIHALHPQCFGWAMSCCGFRREDAEDLLQDVYVGVLDNGLRFNGRSTLKTWLFGVIRQKAASRLRRERLRALLGIHHADRIDSPAPARLPDEAAIASEKRDRTRHALAQLPRRQREVVMLVFYHDLTVEEAAGVMGVSLGSARVHYDRGKKRLASLLAGERP